MPNDIKPASTTYAWIHNRIGLEFVNNAESSIKIFQGGDAQVAAGEWLGRDKGEIPVYP
jgi:hypothetical protein